MGLTAVAAAQQRPEILPYADFVDDHRQGVVRTSRASSEFIFGLTLHLYLNTSHVGAAITLIVHCISPYNSSSLAVR